ncbi:hypothetical protein T492DRAFT_984827 [Pavlovales sp. CCMP2436]|nr:hypothetical protein T492DRAFT_984827 [Pavlovales sp. CCMP2436]|mmetsp:Transcript_3119/g.7669  ORF Transcript_3119/g.7669 Transcript_3119/m.7669 type:complete len:238 (-) Transcript_3119:139-852(-)
MPMEAFPGFPPLPPEPGASYGPGRPPPLPSGQPPPLLQSASAPGSIPHHAPSHRVDSRYPRTSGGLHLNSGAWSSLPVGRRYSVLGEMELWPAQQQANECGATTFGKSHRQPRSLEGDLFRSVAEQQALFSLDRALLQHIDSLYRGDHEFVGGACRAARTTAALCEKLSALLRERLPPDQPHEIRKARLSEPCGSRPPKAEPCEEALGLAAGDSELLHITSALDALLSDEQQQQAPR